ncbi:hypothetical protein TRIUR3_17760 [Triticum urartu]|uniref:Uncharacterized protein n=1 Tax=Triticum urartu TaxID=4572 RepID=M7ZXF4_TRIUA|nr:hypothetical protein TRIUR3_17760 [Triticum urartu]
MVDPFVDFQTPPKSSGTSWKLPGHISISRFPLVMDPLIDDIRLTKGLGFPQPKGPGGKNGYPSEPTAPTPCHSFLRAPDVIGKLRARGHLSGLQIPDDELTEAGAPALFDTVLAAFLAEGRLSAGLPLLPKPLVLGKGGLVDMLPLYLAVRSRGGFAAVTSWAAIAEAVGLEPAADAPIKLVYAKHLWLLEQSIGKPESQDEVAGSSRNAAHRSNAKKDKFLSSHKDHTSAVSAHLKRKREVPLQMLNWVRLVAKNPGDHGAGQNHGSQLSSTLTFRRLMFENIDCSKLPYSTTSPQILDLVILIGCLIIAVGP